MARSYLPPESLSDALRVPEPSAPRWRTMLSKVGAPLGYLIGIMSIFSDGLGLLTTGGEVEAFRASVRLLLIPILCGIAGATIVRGAELCIATMHYRRGKRRAANKQYPLAVESFRASLNNGPFRRAKVHVDAGNALLAIHPWEYAAAAAQHFAWAANIDPRCVDAHLGLGNCHMEDAERWRFFLSRLDRRTLTREEQTQIEVLIEMSRKAAIEAYHLATEVAPQSPVAHYNFGVALGSLAHANGTLNSSLEMGAVLEHLKSALSHFKLTVHLEAHEFRRTGHRGPLTANAEGNIAHIVALIRDVIPSSALAEEDRLSVAAIESEHVAQAVGASAEYADAEANGKFMTGVMNLFLRSKRASKGRADVAGATQLLKQQDCAAAARILKPMVLRLPGDPIARKAAMCQTSWDRSDSLICYRRARDGRVRKALFRQAGCAGLRSGDRKRRQSVSRVRHSEVFVLSMEEGLPRRGCRRSS